MQKGTKLAIASICLIVVILISLLGDIYSLSHSTENEYLIGNDYIHCTFSLENITCYKGKLIGM